MDLHSGVEIDHPEREALACLVSEIVSDWSQAAACAVTTANAAMYCPERLIALYFYCIFVF